MPEPIQPYKPQQLVSAAARQGVNEPELQEIQKVTSGDQTKFNIVGMQQLDSLGTSHWKQYLDRNKLLEVWLPDSESPYRQFAKTKTINSVQFVGNRINPRYSDGERNSEQGLVNLIASGYLKNDTLVILDSGHAHSVAMGVKLATQLGFQPVVMFDSIPHSKGSACPEQGLATLLYFSEQLKELKQSGKIKPDAPPVFILDKHRNDYMPFSDKDKKVNNSYSYVESDFPSAETLKQLGIKRVVYLNEGDQNGCINTDFQSTDRLVPDVKPIVGNWLSQEIEVLYTDVRPYKDTGFNPSFDRMFSSRLWSFLDR